jgi:hypothetical protein
MNRYILVSQKQISRILVCEGCHTWYHIEERRYKDMNNTKTDATQLTSVRTACMCTREIDPFLEANKKPPVFIDVSKGIPKPVVTLVDVKTDKEVVQEKTHIDDILDYHQNT